MKFKHDYDTILTRLTVIISRLYSGERLCKKELAKEFGVSDRTIYRDLKERLISFPIYQDSDKLWRMNEKYAIEKRLSIDEEISLCILQSISNDVGGKIKENSDSLLSRLKNDICHPIYTKIDIEDISECYEIIEKIESAIKDKKTIDITYKKEYDNTYSTNIKSMKISSFDGFWYLIALDNKDRLKKFYLKNISKVEIKDTTYTLDENLIQKMQNSINVWFELNDSFEVVLEANKYISKYFIRKPISTTQKIIETKEDGSIIISVKITSTMEIHSTIMKYIPNIKIISPIWLDDEIKDRFIRPFLER